MAVSRETTSQLQLLVGLIFCFLRFARFGPESRNMLAWTKAPHRLPLALTSSKSKRRGLVVATLVDGELVHSELMT